MGPRLTGISKLFNQVQIATRAQPSWRTQAQVTERSDDPPGSPSSPRPLQSVLLPPGKDSRQKKRSPGFKEKGKKRKPLWTPILLLWAPSPAAAFGSPERRGRKEDGKREEGGPGAQSRRPGASPVTVCSSRCPVFFFSRWFISRVQRQLPDGSSSAATPGGLGSR